MIFTTTWSISKILSQTFDSNFELEIDRKSYKNIGIYNIGYITLKKLMIMKIFIVWILC